MSCALCVCLISGGIDSAVAATVQSRSAAELYLLSVNYGQVMQRELASARAISTHLRAIEHRTVEVRGFKEISRSARTDRELIQYDRKQGLADGYVPSAYPPGRDFTFLSMAAAWAETIILAEPARFTGAKIVIGTNFTDSLDYPDCQKIVYETFTTLLNSSLKMSMVLRKRIEVEAPLIELSKQEVIALGHKLGVPFELTWSCYSGGEKACGRCDACRIRYHGFRNSGLRDPIAYETEAVVPLEVASQSTVSL